MMGCDLAGMGGVWQMGGAGLVSGALARSTHDAGHGTQTSLGWSWMQGRFSAGLSGTRTQGDYRDVATQYATAPARGSVYRWLPGLDADAQRLALEAASDRPGEAIHWFVDDRPVGRTRAGEPLFWPLARGTHQIACGTARGLGDRVEIAVE